MDNFPFDTFKAVFVSEVKYVYEQFITLNREKQPYIFTISAPAYIAINHPHSHCIYFNGNTIEELENDGHPYDSEDSEELYYKFNTDEWDTHSLSSNDFSKSNEIILSYIIDNEGLISDENACYTEEFKKFRDDFFEFIIKNIEQLRAEGFFDSLYNENIFINFEVREYYDEDEMCQIFERLNTKKDAVQFKKWL